MRIGKAKLFCTVQVAFQRTLFRFSENRKHLLNKRSKAMLLYNFYLLKVGYFMRKSKQNNNCQIYTKLLSPITTEKTSKYSDNIHRNIGKTLMRTNLKDTIIDSEKGDIKGAASQVEHKNVLLSFSLVETVGNGGCGGLVDDSHHDEAGNGTGILGCLSLCIVEVCRYSHYGMSHLEQQENIPCHSVSNVVATSIN